MSEERFKDLAWLGELVFHKEEGKAWRERKRELEKIDEEIEQGATEENPVLDRSLFLALGFPGGPPRDRPTMLSDLLKQTPDLSRVASYPKPDLSSSKTRRLPGLLSESLARPPF